MRTTLLTTIALLTVSSQWLGCSYDFCEAVTCGAGAEGAGAEGAGGDGAGGDGGGSGGEGGSPPAECTPADGEVIGADCGVFVAAGATGNGSQASPYGSIIEAVGGLGQASRIYVCGGDTFESSIDLPSDVSIFGGLDCASWRFQPTNPKPEILGDADEPAIAISGSDSSTLSFLRVRSPDAEDEGGSSIAVLVSGAQTTIRDCELIAGAGATGAAGATEPKVTTPATANGGSGEVGCDSDTLSDPGLPGVHTCDVTAVDGGPGGVGLNSTNGGSGDAGVPAGGTAGQGEIGGASPAACTNGGQGPAGAAGNPALGASSDDTGTLSSDGYSPPTAPSGLTQGAFGQGGGGGGGANQCTGAGPGGGGGGAGGCGGNPGKGGESGGGSFALVSVNAGVGLENVTLAAGAGGTGGAGDAGQEGMDGGEAGQAGGPSGACPGGPGGKGGQGGAGGGGRGGPSVGIAYVGEAPAETGTIDITIAPTAASGGSGGNGGGANIGGPGAEGIRAERQPWP